MSQNSDWEKLSTEQQNAVNEWRKRTSDSIVNKAFAFEREHPELRLIYNFTSEPLIRADHPIIIKKL